MPNKNPNLDKLKKLAYIDKENQFKYCFTCASTMRNMDLHYITHRLINSGYLLEARIYIALQYPKKQGFSYPKIIPPDFLDGERRINSKYKGLPLIDYVNLVRRN